MQSVNNRCLFCNQYKTCGQNVKLFLILNVEIHTVATTLRYQDTERGDTYSGHYATLSRASVYSQRPLTVQVVLSRTGSGSGRGQGNPIVQLVTYT